MSKKPKKLQRHRRPHEQSPQAKRTEERAPTKPEIKERLEELRALFSYLIGKDGKMTKEQAVAHMLRVAGVMAGRDV